MHGLIAIDIGRVPYHDRTIQQLKNSGDMRLIRRQGVSDSMLVYDQIFFQMRSQEDFASQAGNNYNVAAEPVFDPLVFQSMKTVGFLQTLPPENNPPLMTSDQAILNRLSVTAYVLSRSNRNVLRALTRLRSNATRLIAFLEKTYHLE